MCTPSRTKISQKTVTLQQGNRKITVKNTPSLTGTPLDTLAQLRKVPFLEGNGPQEATTSEAVKNLRKRAKSKHLTGALDVELRKLEDSELIKAYWNTYYCASSIKQEGKKITSRYCKNRWCLVCNRIRTAQLIKGYEAPLRELKNPQFVTLTRPTVPAELLEQTIIEDTKAFRRILDRLRKRGHTLTGVRKLEATAPPDGKYHPHFHIIMEGEAEAHMLVREWLNEFPESKASAQDVQPANDSTIKELMKYFTKIFSTKKNEDGTLQETDPQRLDVIFRAMQGKRVYQPFGRIKKQAPDVKEDIGELITEEIEELKEADTTYIWVRPAHDYININTGELLTGYTPTETDEKRIKSIRKLYNFGTCIEKITGNAGVQPVTDRCTR
jgi:hypothetical protein